MNRNLIIALILIGSIAALLAGAYWYQSAQVPAIPEATPILEAVPVGVAPSTAEPNNEPTPALTPETANPPLSTGSSLKDIESDLNNTIIEEEIFTDL